LGDFVEIEEVFREWAEWHGIQYRVESADMLFNRPHGHLYYISIWTGSRWASLSSPAPLDRAYELAAEVLTGPYGSDIV
jgi:hypothetical protein